MQTFGEYKVTEVESRSQHGSQQAKLCLDFETLALRCEPPSILVEPGHNATTVTVDSANMPGILVEVGLQRSSEFVSALHIYVLM